MISPDGSRVAVGGNFTTMNGSSNPGYGLALLNADTGANLPMQVNGVVRDANTKAAILTMSGDSSSFYGGGYAYSKSHGNLEGVFRADWNGDLMWVEDCHGDTYSVYAADDDVYVAGHPHYCGNVGGFPQTDPDWTFNRGIAFTKGVRGTVSKDPYTYFNFEGQPRPGLLSWFPDINTGSYTGQSQGPWSVAGNADYIVYGGEFTRVNNKPQQGLVRFARRSIAPNNDGPVVNGTDFVPAMKNFAQGIRVSWPANYDRDNERLTYALIRDGATASPVYTTVADSTFWKRPYLSYLDESVTNGQSYTYRIRVTDPHGNVVDGATVSVGRSAGPAAQRLRPGRAERRAHLVLVLRRDLRHGGRGHRQRPEREPQLWRDHGRTGRGQPPEHGVPVLGHLQWPGRECRRVHPRTPDPQHRDLVQDHDEFRRQAGRLGQPGQRQLGHLRPAPVPGQFGPPVLGHLPERTEGHHLSRQLP